MAEISDLELAVRALSAKAKPYTDLWRYYDGDHELKYSSSRLEQVFRNMDVKFTQNWCATVVDAALERINLKAFDVAGNEELTDRLNRIWADTEMTLDSEDAHTAALVAGEAYIIAWPNDDGAVEVFYNDPRMCHVFYDAENPRIKRFAAKWWVDELGERKYITLYYPDRLEYYVSTGKAEATTSAAGFQPTEEGQATNPYSVVPVFHLRRERRKSKSELANVIPLQDAINKLLADMLVSAEFSAFPQRYIISNVAMTGQLKNSPSEIWDLPGGVDGAQPTEVGELSATELGNYLQAIEQIAMSIGVISRTPKHYFFQTGAANISGDALIALEAPLNKKVETYIKRFQVVWQQVAEFILLAEGATADSTDITAIFDQPQTVQPLAQAQTREINVRSGIPLKWQMRQEGFTAAQLEELDADRLEEEQRTDTLGGMLLREFERGGTV